MADSVEGFGGRCEVIEARRCKAWGRIASLIETAKINGIEPFAHLRATLEAIATGHSQNRIDELLPWNFMPSR